MEITKSESRSASPYEVVASDFRFEPRQDLTLRLLDGGNYRDSDCTQSLFIDSLLRGGDYESMTFSRSDFQGARIEKCDFRECAFRHCDFRSAVFSRCRLVRCDLTQAFLSDCEFFECELVECKVEQATFTDCLVEKTKIDTVSFEQSSVVLNTFREVTFNGVKLGNCTFLFNVTRNCRFTEVLINAESVGYVFGLDAHSLSSLAFVYLGENQGQPGADVVELLEQQYVERKWETGLVMMAFNCGKLSSAVALPMLLEKIVIQARSGIAPKKDEIKFLERILLELHSERSVPLLAASAIAEAVVAYLDDGAVDERARQRLLPTMQGLLGTANAIALQVLAELDSLRQLIESDGTDRPLTLKVTYRNEPSLSVAELINQAVAASGHQCIHSARRIRSESGSFIEFVQTCAQGTVCFMTLLWAVEGCIIRLTAIKARYQVLLQKNPPKQYRQLALSPKLGPQIGMVRAVNDALRFLKPLEWIRTGDKSGLSKENIVSVEVED